jgi:anti-sigma factor ChrR (cupin superfamily)
MWLNRPFEHPNDDQLLAYLDGEMSSARMRVIRNHLKICWKCRSVLADLEYQVESISRLLLAHGEIETDSSVQAKEKFLRWRTAIEAQRKLFFKCRLYRLSSNSACVAFARSDPYILLSIPA